MRNKSKILFFALLIFLLACSDKLEKKKESASWNVEFTAISSPVKTSIRGISVLDSTIAWLSGAKGTILKTSNGGKDWKIVNPPDLDSLDFRAIEALGKKEAIIVSAGFPARVYKTKNSGESWDLVYEISDSAAFLNSIAFKNKIEGIIMGDQLKGRHVILRTNDRGDNWNRIDSIDVPIPLPVENAFAASGSCIAISKTGRFFIGFGGEHSRIFSSVNGYQWKAKTTPMVHGTASSGIYSIAASGKGQIMAVGGNYTYPDSSHFPIVSINDGKSWINTKAKVSGYRSIVDYASYCNCWITGGTNGIEISYNDGLHWEQISTLNINTLQFTPDGKNGIAADGKGNIYLLRIIKD